MQQTRLDTGRIRAARRVIDPVFLGTPLYRCEALEPGLGCVVSIKLETANPVRSFKGRGTEVVASLLAEHGPRAVVCASAGNLGQALAWSGRGRGLDVTVVASRFATAAKLDRIRALGAGLELVDGDHELARERAAAIARYDGIRLVEDSLDLETCEGAATIGLELVEARKRAKPGAQAKRADLTDLTNLTNLTDQADPTDLTNLTEQAELPVPAPPFDTVLIALGGGALATGVGHVLKALAPGVEVICVQPLGAPALTRSWHERRVVTTDSTDTIADGVAGRRPIPAVLDDLLLVADDAVLVQEASIITGMRMLLDHAGLVVEPSAALGIAAILEDRDRFAGRHVVTIVCGSNVDGDAYRRWVGAAALPHRV
ncbi:threonine/serine dehydratase [Streptomyces sp. NBC_01518]|uniref:threonine ammonia-lyase n=1 Tax=Streptomyces sp. NBC_01518 TaxID=2903891 RepID=UPI003870E1B9